jgi:hypothetical protein
MSMHAYGLAFDIAEVTTRAGTRYSVADDWSGDSEASNWLHAFAEQAYEERWFNNVLTPDYNEAHRDHLHLDLAPGEHFLSRKPSLVRRVGAGVASPLAVGLLFVLLMRRRRKA